MGMSCRGFSLEISFFRISISANTSSFSGSPISVMVSFASQLLPVTWESQGEGIVSRCSQRGGGGGGVPEFNTIHFPQGLFLVLLHSPSSAVQAAVRHELQCLKGRVWACRVGVSHRISRFSEFQSLLTNRVSQVLPPSPSSFPSPGTCDQLHGRGMAWAWQVNVRYGRLPPSIGSVLLCRSFALPPASFTWRCNPSHSRQLQHREARNERCELAFVTRAQVKRWHIRPKAVTMAHPISPPTQTPAATFNSQNTGGI